MADLITVPGEVQQFVAEIIAKNGILSTAKVDYGPGAEAGEGYTSKTLTVDINDDDGKSLHLFLKMPTGYSWQENTQISKLFENEGYFYSTVYPAYEAFLKEKGIQDGFRNVPECYGVSGHSVALENVRKKGYRLFTKGKTINEEHIILALKTSAKFHAISYAFKDQKKELYNTFEQNVHLCLGDIVAAGGFDKVINAALQEFLKSLDPVQDKHLLEGSDNLEEVLRDALLNIEKHHNEYSTITQGDFWSNNVMYLYNESNSDVPADIMLVDWQVLRYGSPAIDLSYFFYPTSSEATIEKYEYYLKVYHDELSKRIRELGSDPDTLYPFSVLMQEWKKFARFGFIMCFFVIRSLLSNTDEVPNLEEYPEMFDKINAGEDISSIMPQMKSNALYLSRLKLVFTHFVKHGLLEGDLLGPRV